MYNGKIKTIKLSMDYINKVILHNQLLMQLILSYFEEVDLSTLIFERFIIFIYFFIHC